VRWKRFPLIWHADEGRGRAKGKIELTLILGFLSETRIPNFSGSPIREISDSCSREVIGTGHAGKMLEIPR
jgi:hypothetical protein